MAFADIEVVSGAEVSDVVMALEDTEEASTEVTSGPADFLTVANFIAKVISKDMDSIAAVSIEDNASLRIPMRDHQRLSPYQRQARQLAIV